MNAPPAAPPAAPAAAAAGAATKGAPAATSTAAPADGIAAIFALLLGQAAPTPAAAAPAGVAPATGKEKDKGKDEKPSDPAGTTDAGAGAAALVAALAGLVAPAPTSASPAPSAQPAHAVAPTATPIVAAGAATPAPLPAAAPPTTVEAAPAPALVPAPSAVPIAAAPAEPPKASAPAPAAPVAAPAATSAATLDLPVDPTAPTPPPAIAAAVPAPATRRPVRAADVVAPATRAESLEQLESAARGTRPAPAHPRTAASGRTSNGEQGRRGNDQATPSPIQVATAPRKEAAADPVTSTTAATGIDRERFDRLVDGLAARLKLSHAGDGARVRMNLEPRELGEIVVRLHIRDGIAQASLITDNHDATRMLQGTVSDLRTALADRGVQLDRVDVRTSGDPAGDRRQQPGQDAGSSHRRQTSESWRFGRVEAASSSSDPLAALVTTGVRAGQPVSLLA